MNPACDDGVERKNGNIEMSVSDGPSPSEDLPEEVKETRKWKWSVIFLCFFGFMSSIKPGEPFITPYLLSDEKNFTIKEVGGRFDTLFCLSVPEHKRTNISWTLTKASAETQVSVQLSTDYTGTVMSALWGVH